MLGAGSEEAALTGSGAGGGAGGCGVLVLALAQGEGWGCQWSPSVGSFCGPLRLPSHKERLPRGGPAAAVCLALGWPPVPIRERVPAEVRREGVSWR